MFGNSTCQLHSTVLCYSWKVPSLYRNLITLNVANSDSVLRIKRCVPVAIQLFLMITELICVTGPPSKPAGLCHKHLSFEISRRLPRVVQGSHRKRPLRTFFPTAIITPAQNEINKIAERTRINNCNKPEFCTKYRIMSCWESRHDIGGTLANIP